MTLAKMIFREPMLGAKILLAVTTMKIIRLLADQGFRTIETVSHIFVNGRKSRAAAAAEVEPVSVLRPAV